jgi:hypothetical protein
MKARAGGAAGGVPFSPTAPYLSWQHIAGTGVDGISAGWARWSRWQVSTIGGPGGSDGDAGQRATQTPRRRWPTGGDDRGGRSCGERGPGESNGLATG